MSAYLVVLVAAGATAAATGLGALPFLLRRYPRRTWLGTANALAVGFMVGASIGLVVEGARAGPMRTATGVSLGWPAMALAHRALGRHGELRLGSLRGADAAKALAIIAGMTVHSFAEGVGVGVSFGNGEAFGLLIALAIAVHNVPEGLAISLVLVPRGARVATAAAWSVFSSLPQPLMALPSFGFVRVFEPVLPVGLGFAAGGMAWLALTQLVPDAAAETSRRAVVAAAVPCAAAMVALQLLLIG